MRKSPAPPSSTHTAGDTSYLCTIWQGARMFLPKRTCILCSNIVLQMRRAELRITFLLSCLQLYWTLCYQLTTRSLLAPAPPNSLHLFFLYRCLLCLALSLCCAFCSQVINEGLFSLIGWVTGFLLERSGVMRYGEKDCNKGRFALPSLYHFHIVILNTLCLWNSIPVLFQSSLF